MVKYIDGTQPTSTEPPTGAFLLKVGETIIIPEGTHLESAKKNDPNYPGTTKVARLKIHKDASCDVSLTKEGFVTFVPANCHGQKLVFDFIDPEHHCARAVFPQQFQKSN